MLVVYLYLSQRDKEDDAISAMPRIWLKHLGDSNGLSRHLGDTHRPQPHNKLENAGDILYTMHIKLELGMTGELSKHSF